MLTRWQQLRLHFGCAIRHAAKAAISVPELAVAILLFVILFLCSCSQRPLEDQAVAPSSGISREKAEQFAAFWVITDSGRAWSRIAPTGSMAPFLDSHSVALWEYVGAGTNLRKGDVVVFDRGDLPNVCHRIVDLNTTSVYMSGDNVRSDGWFPRAAVKMRLCGIIYTNRE